MKPAAPGLRAGRVMMILAWLIGMALATYLFGQWQESRYNPNSTPQSQFSQNAIEVVLERNHQGHYVANGFINGQRVTFLLDTGATQVALPSALAQRLGLELGSPIQIHTANGLSQARRTRLNTLQLGDIELRDVAALSAPNMHGDEVLLGMSALKQLEFTQKGSTLVLRQFTSQ